MASFDALGAFAKPGDDPEGACRPFSEERSGLVPSGGAAMLVVESLESAKKRGAEILAEIGGYGFSSDGSHLTQPSGEGALRAMKQCLSGANVRPDEVDYINAHGTSTKVNDQVETLACKNALGQDAQSTPVSSIKSMMGHLIAAAGAVNHAEPRGMDMTPLCS